MAKNKKSLFGSIFEDIISKFMSKVFMRVFSYFFALIGVIFTLIALIKFLELFFPSFTAFLILALISFSLGIIFKKRR